MSQVYVEYENGLKIYVNRHTFKVWKVNFSGIPGFYSFHALLNGEDCLYVGNTNGNIFNLPPGNGWVCYSTN